MENCIKKIPLRVILIVLAVCSIVAMSLVTMSKYVTNQQVDDFSVDIYPSGRFLIGINQKLKNISIKRMIDF